MKRGNKMMKRSMAFLLVSLLAVATSEATLLAYEGFDYSTGSLSGQNGGAGWGGAWSSGDKYTVVTNSLAMANLPFAATGNSIIGDSSVNRNLSSGIDFSQDGTYYSSFIVKRTGWESTDGGGEWFDFHFRTTGYTDVALAGISSSEKFEARVGTGSAAHAGDAATTNPYFLVSKIVTHASGNDEVYLKAYSASDTIDANETADWTVTATADTNLLANMVTLWAGTDGDDGNGVYQAAVDEIRVGTTWQDVVPEPGVLSLMAVVGVGIVFIRKRIMM